MYTTKLFLTILFFIHAIALPLLAQPSWVKEAIREGQNVTAHEDASAILLHKVSKLEISKSGDAKTKTEIAYKILTREGKQFGMMYLPIAPFLKVRSLKGWTIKADGSNKSLPKENIAIVDISEEGYDDDLMQLAALPDVEAGDIVAFETEVEEKGWTSLYQSFTFQTQQPVKFARFSVKTPENWQLKHSGWRTEQIEFAQQENIYTWEARDLEYQKEEPLAPPWKYLWRRVSITCFDRQKSEEKHFADWPAVADWVADLHYPKAIPNQDVINETRKLTNGLTDFEDKIRAISAFSQNDIRYVAVEINKERWVPRNAETTLFNRYGDCKDKTTLMRAMLQAVDIPSVPVLANASSPVNPHLPTPFQFDHCIIAIPIEQREVSPRLQNAVVDNWLFFDPTDETLELGELPWVLRGGTVMLGVQQDSVLYRLPYPEPQDFRRVYRAEAQLNTDGSFSADVNIIDFGGFASGTRYINRVISTNEQIDDWRLLISEVIPDVKLENYNTGDNGDSAWASFTIRGESIIQRAGALILLRPDFFHAAESSPLTAKERQHPVWFGPPVEIETHITWQLPDSWNAEIDTAAFESRCDAASIFSKMSLSGSTLHCLCIERKSGRLMWPEYYEAAQKFSKDLSFAKGQTVLINNQ